MQKIILNELKVHAPFTLFGALTGIGIMVVFVLVHVPHPVTERLFWVFHPFHVFLSALVTAGMYRLHGPGKLLPTLMIGFFGSIGIGSLSDCIIPYTAEVLLDLPNRGIHLGLIEKPLLVSLSAFTGIAFACWKPATRFPHAGHVLLSTWASLFHITMALGADIGLFTVLVIGLFLFLAVWIPCCTSDIVFPLLFRKGSEQ